MQYRRASYAAGVRIVCKSYPCDFARSLAGAYRLDSVPVFPPEECNQVDGACTCSWEIIFVDDEEPDEWKVARSVHPLAGGRLEQPELPTICRPVTPANQPREERPSGLARLWMWLGGRKSVSRVDSESAPAPVRDAGRSDTAAYRDVASLSLTKLRGDDHSCPQFTLEQYGMIRRAVMAGRRALLNRGSDPMIFAATFLDAGGFQVPGLTVDAVRLRGVGSFVLFALEAGSIDAAEIRRAYTWAGDEVARAVLREVTRAHLEAVWYVIGRRDDVEGFKVIVSGARSPDACAGIMQCDSFGMGEGCYPKHEIMILPPCCDGSIKLENIYRKTR